MNDEFMNNSQEGRDGSSWQNEDNARPARQTGADHTPRPRINRNFRPAGSSDYRNARQYGQRNNTRNEGTGYQNNREGGYGSQRNGYSREGYRQGGYQPRENRWSKTRYANEGEGGYQPRYNENAPRYNNEGGYRNTEDGYGQRRQQGGFAPRHRNTQGNFRQRYPQQGGGGYRARKSGYDPNAKYSHKKRLEYKEENYDPTVPLRLNKFLANAGVCSRRDADKYIEAGVVSVNGVVVTELGAKVLRTDEVRFHDNVVKMEKKVYVLLNKPKGYVTTSEDPQNRKTVMDLVVSACPERIYPVGRLDRNTTGVLLLTNDGEMASKLTHPKFLKKKIYHVTTDRNVTAADIQQIAEGITLDDGDIKADAVEYAHPTDKKQIGIEIHSGKNRIVRRIFESLGYHVTKLDRVYFAGLTKKNVRRGDWRYLTEKEVQMLRMGAFE